MSKQRHSREVISLTPGVHRAGFIAVVGKPNVGKSTLMNLVLGEKLAIVSPKPQTTRIRQLGILTETDAQMIFVDTPGIHHPRTKLAQFMVEVATTSVAGADVVLFLVDASHALDESDRAIADSLGKIDGIPVVVAINKCDLVESPERKALGAEMDLLLPAATVLEISSLTGSQVDLLLGTLKSFLPISPNLYPDDQLTDTYVRDNVAEIIREKILILASDEVPHSVAVIVDEFKERSNSLTYISSTIYVEKESHKGILIGLLKTIGANARRDIEGVLGTQVYLELWVKVLKNWRRDGRLLRRLGYYHQQ